MILVGDIGGTKTLLALYRDPGPAAAPARERIFPSGAFPTFERVLGQFLGEGPDRSIRGACLAVAGPVLEGRCKTTNLPWELEEQRLAETLEAPVRLLNDLEAAAHGTLSLGPDDVEVLQAGRPRPGNVAVIAAGTGLGEAMLVRAAGRSHGVASEGGHADFAPRSDREVALLQYLRQEHGHVSYERVLSGPGLHNIYRFLRDTGVAGEPGWLRDRLAAGDPGRTITEVALAGGHSLCSAALDLFVSIYGAEAGNLALKAFALGGVYVAGGIAPKILPKLRDGTFIRAFCDKGRFAEFLRSIPVRVVLNQRLPLLGALRIAAELAARGDG